MIKSIETYYKGYLCRSRTEARWMVAFDKVDIKYEYEPEGFDLGKAGKYLPDFYLPQVDMYAEVKGRPFNIQELKKAKALALESKKVLLLLDGQPARKAYSLFPLIDSLGKGFEYIDENNKKSSWSLAWSWACYCFEITKLEMVENFFYAWSANQLNAALRIIPIGSTKAQLIQRDLLEIISKVSEEIMDKEIDDIYFGNVGLAMAQQNHNDLYTKLFRN